MLNYDDEPSVSKCNATGHPASQLPSYHLFIHGVPDKHLDAGMSHKKTDAIPWGLNFFKTGNLCFTNSV